MEFNSSHDRKWYSRFTHEHFCRHIQVENQCTDCLWNYRYVMIRHSYVKSKSSNCKFCQGQGRNLMGMLIGQTITEAPYVFL